jgi:S-DNA-T family DNA segregation ATPase FtsK/SpoIIIE
MKFMGGGFTDKGGMGVDGLALVGLGLFTNALAPWMGMSTTYGTFAAVGGIGIVVLDFFLNHKGKLEKLFINCGLYINTSHDKLLPRVMKVQKHATKTEYILSLPPGMELANFNLKHDAIEQNIRKPVKFEYRNGIIVMTIQKEELKTTYKFTQIPTKGDLEVVLGYCYSGPLTIDLATSPSPHMGVFGETNGGKSVILRGLITQLMLDRKNVDIYLIDPKRVEFPMFQKYVKEVSKSDDEIVDTLSFLKEETDRRYKLLERAGCVNIKEYGKLKYILCIIDEYADLAENDQMNNLVNYIARKARAVGIHLILACQRPDKDILNGKIKANIGNILGLKTTTAVNSRVIIDDDGLEKLRGFGHGLLKEGSRLTEMQSMMVTKKEVETLLEAVYGKEKG